MVGRSKNKKEKEMMMKRKWLFSPKEATNTMMVDLLAKFGVDACKTSLEFISPPPGITFFLSGFIENLKKSLLIRMDLNKKSGIIQFFATKIEENANWTFKTLLLTCQKLI